MRYKVEFPEFTDVETAERLIALGWADTSSRANACPSFRSGDAELFVGDVGSGPRRFCLFAVTGTDDAGWSFDRLDVALDYAEMIA